MASIIAGNVTGSEVSIAVTQVDCALRDGVTLLSGGSGQGKAEDRSSGKDGGLHFELGCGV